MKMLRHNISTHASSNVKLRLRWHNKQVLNVLVSMLIAVKTVDMTQLTYASRHVFNHFYRLLSKVLEIQQELSLRLKQLSLSNMDSQWQ